MGSSRDISEEVNSASVEDMECGVGAQMIDPSGGMQKAHDTLGLRYEPTPEEKAEQEMWHQRHMRQENIRYAIESGVDFASAKDVIKAAEKIVAYIRDGVKED